jgi:hypothetical protein
MVMIIVLLLAAWALPSCGSAPYLSSRNGAPPSFQNGSDAAMREIVDDPALMEDEFDEIERLRENPIDPVGASREELLSIPGFPEDLAGRVAAETGERRSARGWIERLTPPERYELYRYRDYLLLPDEPPARLRIRWTEGGISPRTAAREEGYVSCAAGGWKALWRARRLEGGSGSSCCLSGDALSGAVRMHAGAFTADFALGLILGGSRQPYVFSSTYPFRSPRWFAGSTSFSAPSLQGAAGEFWRGNLHGALIAGRSRMYRSGRFELDEGELYGGRIALRVGPGEFGAAGLSGAFTSRGVALSIDGRWRSGPIDLGLELASRERGEPGVISALSYRAAGTRFALLLQAIPSGMTGTFCGATGGASDGASSYGSIAAVLEREIVARVRLRAAFDRSRRTDGVDCKTKHAARAELEKGWRRAFVKLSWVSSIDEREEVIPYPWAGSAASDRTNSLGLLSNLRAGRGTDLRIALRGVRTNEGSGYLIAPILSMSLFCGRLKPAASFVSYRTFRGKPTCWFYEPSLEGSYPWRAAPKDRERYAVLISYTINMLRVSAKVALETREVSEASLQAAIEY